MALAAGGGDGGGMGVCTARMPEKSSEVPLTFPILLAIWFVFLVLGLDS